MAAHSTASSGVVVAGGEAARFGAVLGGGLDDGGAMDGWLDLSALSGLRDVISPRSCGTSGEPRASDSVDTSRVQI